MSRRRTLRRALGALGALLVALLAGYLGWVYAQIVHWRENNPATTAFMDARLEALRAGNPRARLAQRWVPYARIAPALKQALIAAEDAKFLDHEGFDWEAIQDAAEKNLRKGRLVAGGSTISQQLAKNLFLSGKRTALRKAHEAVITIMLERVLSKRRIFEIYLNVIEWGEGVFGAEAAARHHFGVGAAELDELQAAWLAAMVPNPRLYDRRGSTPALERRASIIRGRMPQARVP